MLLLVVLSLTVTISQASDRQEKFRQLHGFLVEADRQRAVGPDPVLTDPDLSDVLIGGSKAWVLPTVVHPPEQEATSDRVRLGRALFHDVRLSRDFKSSCATCHNPDLGFSDGKQFSDQFGGGKLSRHTPSLYSAPWQKIFMWDGRFQSLPEQAFGPIESPQEMNLSAQELVKRLEADEDMQTQFARAWPDLGISKESIAQSLAVFQRTIHPGVSRFDRFIAGDKAAMTEQEIQGFALFLNPTKGRCVFCHHPPHFTDQKFHDIGVFRAPWQAEDLGRGAIDPRPGHRFAFKTPGLRNVALHPPYFHDGSARNLREVVSFYNRGGDMENPSPLIRPLGLEAEEVEAIAQFMQALTDENLETKN